MYMYLFQARQAVAEFIAAVAVSPSSSLDCLPYASVSSEFSAGGCSTALQNTGPHHTRGQSWRPSARVRVVGKAMREEIGWGRAEALNRGL